MSITTLLMIVQVIAALTIIVLVLLQQGKGADMGSSFGSGSAGSLFGASGAANFLSRTTKWAAVVFFASTIGLAYVTHAGKSSGPVDTGVMQGFQGSSVPKDAAAPASAKGDASVPTVPAAPVK
jgi:preprotein translocase subunit SecG